MPSVFFWLKSNQNNNRFQGSTLKCWFELLGTLGRILRLDPGTEYKVLIPISDVCLGSTSEEEDPLCHVFVISDLRLS